jgi:Uma2 family endonuclease
MAPERNRYALAKLDAAIALRATVRAAGAACTVLPDGPSLAVDDHRVYEPDASVVCGAVYPESLSIQNPVILVEVLSPSSRGVDTGRKLHLYMGLASVRHSLVIDAEPRLIVHHHRDGEDGPISTAILRDGLLRLDPPGLTVPVADFFASSGEPGCANPPNEKRRRIAAPPYSSRHRPKARRAKASDHLILPSLYSTCLRTTGSYFRTAIFSVIVREFFFVT